uniref:Uncharacterized protein TCIL3000_11_6130 n=1 Tax=Trypanosoma congolense (strain IL3000) TaxID=1068625 RepID=G0V0L9_TRYCI|nr:unnamed protein product [Trypanosoma congolense IL3000]
MLFQGMTGLRGMSLMLGRPNPLLFVNCHQALTGSSMIIGRRNLWNPFALPRGENTKVTTPIIGRNDLAQQHSILERANKGVVLHNERLLDACLELLSFCGGNDTTGSSDGAAGANLHEEVTSALAAVVGATLHDVGKTPAEQFDRICEALCLPDVRANPEIQRRLLVVLEAVLPEALFRVFESEDLFTVISDDVAGRKALALFVHALIGVVDVPEGVSREELVFVYLEDVREAFPSLRKSAALMELEKDVTSIVLKSKLFTLLSKLCAEFDVEGSGRIDLSDLQQVTERVLGDKQARMFLDGVRPDKEGKICYMQLVSLLTRPPPRKRPKL